MEASEAIFGLSYRKLTSSTVLTGPVSFFRTTGSALLSAKDDGLNEEGPIIITDP